MNAIENEMKQCPTRRQKRGRERREKVREQEVDDDGDVNDDGNETIDEERRCCSDWNPYSARTRIREREWLGEQQEELWWWRRWKREEGRSGDGRR